MAKHQKTQNQNYSLSLYEKALPDELPLQEKIIRAKKLGFDSLEICIDLDAERQKRLNWTNHDLTEMKQFLTAYQISLPTLSLSALRGNPLGSLDKDKIQTAKKMLTKALIICKELAIDVLLINAYDVYDKPSTTATRANFERNLRKAVKLAEKYQVVIGLENAEMPFADTLSKVNKWVEKINSPYLKIYYDPANAYNALAGDTQAVIADYQEGAHNICAIHLKDSLPGEYRLTPYGEGHVAFDEIIPVMLQDGHRTYTAELFQPQGKDGQAYAKWVNAFLRSHLHSE